MRQIVTTAMVLHRVNYGEADRILTVLTPDQGKLSLMARGVRREKSKLAGGVELFSISEITYIPGRGDISTLTSSRLNRHFRNVAGSLERTMLGYELLKITHKITESQADSDYYDILAQGLTSLDDPHVSVNLIAAWFNMRLLSISGHAPNLRTDTAGHVLSSEKTYHFNHEDTAFEEHANGYYSANHIKLLRLTLLHPLEKIAGVAMAKETLEQVGTLSEELRDFYLPTR